MQNEELCGRVIEFLQSHSNGEDIDEDIKSHIAMCDFCRNENEKYGKMSELVKASAPECPELRSAVLDRIKSEGIKVDEQKRKRHFPIGTLAAAAAVLVIYVSVYGSKLPFMAFNAANDAALYDAAETEEMYYAEEESAEAAIEEAVEEYSLNSQAFEAVKEGAAAKSAGGEVLMYSKAPSHTDGAVGKQATFDAVADFAETESYHDDMKISTEDIPMLAYADEEAESEAAEDHSEAEELFEKYFSVYPDRITRADVENVGWEVYESFVLGIVDAESEYTLEALIEYSEK